MPWGPFFSGLPTTGSPAKAYVDQTSWNAVIDNFQTWKGSVNGGGFTLSNVNIITGSAGVSGSASLTFPAIPDGAQASQTFALAGAITGDQVLEGWPSTLEAGLSGVMLVTAPDTVQVRLVNQSGGPITPAVQTFSATTGLGAAPFRAPLTFPAIPDGGSASLTFTATGATTAQKVMASWPLTLEAGLAGLMRVSAPNTIEVRLTNNSGAALTPAVQTFGATLV